MIRAGVFIGVDQTGTLQRLHDAAAGARHMHEWALAQGMVDETHAKLITDENGRRVTPDMILTAIQDIIDGAGVDQLIVYFAGHGVNINRSEFWLLTDAPRNGNAAVNVAGSEYLARYSGIGHVAFISDACRVAADGIQAQGVRGQDIFPNDSPAEKARPVDQFFACGLGKTAAELKDAAVAATAFSALYTDALLDALNGKVEEVLEPATEATDAARYIRAGRLQAYLEREVPRRVIKRKLQNKVNQNPDAVLSLHTHWLSRITTPPSSRTRFGFAPDVVVPHPSGPSVIARNLVRTAEGQDSERLSQEISLAKESRSDGVRQVGNAVERIASPFGPDHFESNCGFKIRGPKVVEAYSPFAQVSVLDDGRLLRIEGLTKPASSVLLRFADGRGTVIPAIPDFLAALTFDEDDELVDVSYEPSANTWRWPEYSQRAQELRTLRAIAATASQYRRFRLQGEGAMQIASKMQYAKLVDPTFSVYAAYAYYDLQALDRIREMSGYLRGDLGFTFFDLALLSRQLVDRAIDTQLDIVPFVPLLSQGWALLRANRVRLPSALEGLESMVIDSLWSLYSAPGVDKLRSAMQAEVLP